MEGSRVKLTEVNPHLVCVLCHGYFVDATTIAECLHSFCKSCIFRYLERKSYCPICEVQVHNTKLYLSLKPDKTLQDIVYKLVPGLFHNEMQRRRDFYKTRPHRDEHLESECRGVGLDRIIYSPEQMISISLEFYDADREREEWSNNTSPKPVTQVAPSGTKRYLRCPAGFKMAHLKKFLRQKYNLPLSCNVEIMYRRESLPDSYSLMDIAYIYTWKRSGPMRFYYRLPEIIEKKIVKLQAPTETSPIATQPEVTILAQETENAKCKSKGAEKKSQPEKRVPPAKPKEPKPQPPDNKTGIEQKAKENSLNASNVTEEAAKATQEQSKDATAKTDPSLAARPLSKQDEISVSALLSLSEVRPPTKPDHEFTVPLPPPDKNGLRTSLDMKKSAQVMGKITGGLKPSVNRIATELAENKNHRLLAEQQQQRCLQSPAKLMKESAAPEQKNIDNPILEVKSTPSTTVVEGIKSPTITKNQNATSPNDTVKLPLMEHSTKTFSVPKAKPESKPEVDPKSVHRKLLALPKPQEKKPPITMRLSSTEVISSSLLNKQPTPRPIQNGTHKLTFQPGPRPPFRNNTVGIAKTAAKEEISTDPTKRMILSKEVAKPEIVLNTSNGSLTITGQTEDKAAVSASPTATIVPTPTPTSPSGGKQKNGQAQRVNGHSLTITVEPTSTTPSSPPKAIDGTTPSIHHSNINNRMPTFHKAGVGRERKVGSNTLNGKLGGHTLDRRIQLLYNSQGAGKPGAQGSPQTTAHQRQQPPKQESRLASWLNNRFPPVPQPPKPATPVPEKLMPPAPRNQQDSSPPPKSPADKPSEDPTEGPKPDRTPQSDTKTDTVQSSAAKLDREVTMLKRKLEELRKSSAEAVCEITQENPDPEEAKRRRDVTPNVSIELMRASDINKEFTIQSKDQMAGSSVKVKDKKRPMPGLKALQEVEPKRKPEGEQQPTPVKKPKLSVSKKEGPSQTAALDLSKPLTPPGGPSFIHEYRMALQNRAAAVAQQSNALQWLLANRSMLHSPFLPTGGK